MIVWDVVLGHRELDTLDVRLHELAGVVDRVVVIEAAETFTNLPKPLYFTEAVAAGRFRDFAGRLHVVPVALPDGVGAWEREYASRNQSVGILEGLGATDDDLVIAADLDEIPRASAIAGRIADAERIVAQGILVALDTPTFRYCFNWRADIEWIGCKVTSFRHYREAGPQAMRGMGGDIVREAGWHCSSFGGPEAVRDKLMGFSHTEAVRPEHLDLAHIERCLNEGRDVCGNWEQARWVEIEETNPPAWLVSELVAGRMQIMLHPSRRVQRNG